MRCYVPWWSGAISNPRTESNTSYVASRSRLFYMMILAKEKEIKIHASQIYEENRVLKKLKEIRKLLTSKPSYQTSVSSISRKLTIVLEEFEPSVFERLLRYIHCGMVSVDVFSVVGLLNVAEKFKLECMKNACWEFAVSCICLDLVHDLIASANEYSNCKLTNDLFKEIQEISLSHPELLFCTQRSRSNSCRDGSDCRPKSITTNGLLMRSVL